MRLALCRFLHGVRSVTCQILAKEDGVGDVFVWEGNRPVSC